MNDDDTAVGNNGEEYVEVPEWVAEEAAERWRMACHDHLYNEYPSDREIVEEYISEAEHQDGIFYWFQFRMLEDLSTDFELYKENREGYICGDQERWFSSIEAALPYVHLGNSTFKITTAVVPNEMIFVTHLRDKDWNGFRIDNHLIQTFKLRTWKEVMWVAGKLWRIAQKVER